MRSYARLIIGIVAGVFLSAIAGSVFLTRDITYEVDLENPDNKVQVEGLVKKYEMETGENGEIMEVQNWTMNQDEIEIKVKAPPDFEKYSKLVVEAEFENPDAPTLEVGVKKQVDYLLGEPLYDWEWHFLDNKYLNEFKTYLGQEWSVISDENLGLSLFQKEQKYESVREFLEKPPEEKTETVEQMTESGVIEKKTIKHPVISTLQSYIKQKYSLPLTDRKKTIIPYSFRGDLDLSVYFDREISDPLTLSFLKQDMNQYEGSDVYELRVFDDRKNLIFYKIFSDDGDELQSRKASTRHFLLNIPIEKTGLYSFEFRISSHANDSIIRNISINSPHVMANNFNIVDIDGFSKGIMGKPVIFYALSGEMSLNPANTNGDQRVLINQNPSLVEYKKENDFILTQNKNKIQTSFGNLIVQHKENPISFFEDSLFDTNPQKTSQYKTLLGNEIEFVLAKYTKTEKKDSQKSVSFDVRNIIIDENGIFSIKMSAKDNEIYNGEILFQKIFVKFKK